VSLLAEPQRRKLFKVAADHAVVGWLAEGTAAPCALPVFD